MLLLISDSIVAICKSNSIIVLHNMELTEKKKVPSQHHLETNFRADFNIWNLCMFLIIQNVLEYLNNFLLCWYYITYITVFEIIIISTFLGLCRSIPIPMIIKNRKRKFITLLFQSFSKKIKINKK
jgi:hypothetical protein